MYKYNHPLRRGTSPLLVGSCRKFHTCSDCDPWSFCSGRLRCWFGVKHARQFFFVKSLQCWIPFSHVRLAMKWSNPHHIASRNSAMPMRQPMASQFFGFPAQIHPLSPELALSLNMWCAKKVRPKRGPISSVFMRNVAQTMRKEKTSNLGMDKRHIVIVKFAVVYDMGFTTRWCFRNFFKWLCHEPPLV